MKVKDFFNMKVSVFETVTNTNNNIKMKVLRMSDAILLGHNYINNIEYLRQFSDKETVEKENMYKQYKSTLPVWTTSCLCGNGVKDILTLHNVLCIDIDFQDNEGMDVEKVKEDLIKLPSVFYVSLSVGGRGVFGLMGLSGSDDFKERFNSVREYIFRSTGYVIDKSCSNPNRLRFISYDENPIFKDFESEIVLYPNKKSDKPDTLYRPLIDITLPKKHNSSNDLELLENDQFCIDCADYCINRLGYRTEDYSNWLSHIGSLSSLGIEGEQLAIQLSRQSRGYKNDNDVMKTIKLLSSKPNNRQYLTRYFKMCKESLGKNWINEVKEIYKKD